MGGAERQLTGLAIHLRQLGHEVDVVVMRGNGPLKDLIRESGVRIVELFDRSSTDQHILKRLAQWVLYPWRAFQYCMNARPDVIHAWLLASYAVMLPVGQVTGVRVRICGRRGMRASQRSPRLAKLAQGVSNLAATWTTCNSEAIAEEIRRFERRPRSALSVISNAVDIPAVRANPGHNPPSGVVVANFHPYKGHSDLVEALKCIGVPVRLLLVGDGPMRRNIERQARQLPETVQLEFLGRVLNPAELLLQCQYAVLPSHTEGMPNAVLEAMAWGLPVVATRVGGTPALLQDGKGGLLVPAGSPSALAAAIRMMATDCEFRVSAGVINRAEALKYSWGEITAAYDALYRLLLQKTGGGR